MELRGDREWFLSSVVGKPYDRERFNCWHLAMLTQASLFARSLPLVDCGLVDNRKARRKALEAHPALPDWPEVPGPCDGALVFMARVRDHHEHCGVYLDTDRGGRILHTDMGHGVVLDTLAEVQHIRRWRWLTYRVPAE